MANNFDTDNSDFLMGRNRMTNIEIEVAALDKAIAHLVLLRDAVACQSLPMNEFGLRKKQTYDHWVAGEHLEDCGK
jgi:hypothetical protein